MLRALLLLFGLQALEQRKLTDLRLYSLRSFFFSAEISVDFGTCLNARKTNQKPLSMPGLGIGRGSFFMTYSKLRTAALEPVAGIPALYPKYVWQAQGLPLLARQSQR